MNFFHRWMFALVGLTLAAGVLVGFGWVAILFNEWATTVWGETGSVVSGTIIAFIIITFILTAITD